MLTDRSLLRTEDLSLEEIELVLKNADSFLEIMERKVKKVPTLRGKTIANIFFEPSTRTRNSFEIAAKRLSADMINFSASTSSLKKGESIMDTIETIIAMKVNLLVIRHGHSGVLDLVAKKVSVPIINAGDGKNQHPTQALLDIYTIKKIFGRLEGLKVAIVGDFINSRVARSNVEMFSRAGMEVAVVAPSMLLPPEDTVLGVRTAADIDRVVEDVDVLYMLRMQFERQQRKFYPSVREYNRFLGLNLQRLNRMKEDAVVMHPGPVNRGIEISEEVMDSAGRNGRLVIPNQVTHGVAIRMALLYLILSQQEES
ncbi:MAG: aspartate carbamoyltransferase catalytic subunit [Actinomycetota bacterium]